MADFPSSVIRNCESYFRENQFESGFMLLNSVLHTASEINKQSYRIPLQLLRGLFNQVLYDFTPGTLFKQVDLIGLLHNFRDQYYMHTTSSGTSVETARISDFIETLWAQNLDNDQPDPFGNKILEMNSRLYTYCSPLFLFLRALIVTLIESEETRKKGVQLEVFKFVMETIHRSSIICLQGRSNEYHTCYLLQELERTFSSSKSSNFDASNQFMVPIFWRNIDPVLDILASKNSASNGVKLDSNDQLDEFRIQLIEPILYVLDKSNKKYMDIYVGELASIIADKWFPKKIQETADEISASCPDLSLLLNFTRGIRCEYSWFSLALVATLIENSANIFYVNDGKRNPLLKELKKIVANIDVIIDKSSNGVTFSKVISRYSKLLPIECKLRIRGRRKRKNISTDHATNNLETTVIPDIVQIYPLLFNFMLQSVMEIVLQKTDSYLSVGYDIQDLLEFLLLLRQRFANDWLEELESMGTHVEGLADSKKILQLMKKTRLAVID